MFIDYFYNLSLIDANGRSIKRVYILPEELNRFAPSYDYKKDCLFLTEWAEDRKKELLGLLGKKKGVFNLTMVRVVDGICIAGSDYIIL